MFFSRKELLALAAAFVLPVALRGAEQNPARAPRVVMNIVNFVRSLDPRHPRSWHGEALREEAAKSDPALTEFGLWFEMSRPLNEAAGLPWRPKHDPSWDWDWFINPGFLMAYTHAERNSLGTDPRSLGDRPLLGRKVTYCEPSASSAQPGCSEG